MNLRNLVELIDTKIVSQVGMITTLQPIKAFGLAEFYYDQDTFYPGIINGGKIEEVFLQDNFNLSWYSRNTNGSYTNIENNFGNKNNKVEETTEIKLVAYTNRIKTGFSLETIKDIFVSSIPSVLSKSECESNEIDGCQIELISHELDTYKVYKEETNSNAKVRVGVEFGLISIRYNIKATYRRGCRVICEC
jgi:hypothetical protein